MVKCVKEISVRPTPVAMVTKILKFPHKITITQLAFKVSPRIFTKLGVAIPASSLQKKTAKNMFKKLSSL